MLISRFPSLDLHGEIGDIAKIRVNDFIEENIILGNDTIVIIHGIGKGIVKKCVYEVLSNSKDVVGFSIDVYNPGVTIVKIKIPI